MATTVSDADKGLMVLSYGTSYLLVLLFEKSTARGKDGSLNDVSCEDAVIYQIMSRGQSMSLKIPMTISNSDNRNSNNNNK